MNPSFDLISDLNLTSEDHFEWDGKVTSLYCIVAGNISSDPAVVKQTLIHLTAHYQGVFFIDGSREHPYLNRHSLTIKNFIELGANIPNLVYLHNNVVVVDGVALLGVNGWYGNHEPTEDIADMARLELFRLEDIRYLNNTVGTLQLHPDVRDIIVISNSLPSQDLAFNSRKYAAVTDPIGLSQCISSDTEDKIKYWFYGGYPVAGDVTISNVRYICNPKFKTEPYWPQRIEIKPRSRP